jgi:two-component system, chemotaxis family, protein-glutamate methylesterase/glutaminase
VSDGTPPVASEIRVVIVDDSAVARELLKSVLESDPGIRVVGMAATGSEGLELTVKLKPDLVTMDLVMPGMDGMEATQRIMASHPTPILFFSSFFERGGSYTRSDALAAGALDIVEKPTPMPDAQWTAAAGVLVKKVRALAQVTVVTHILGAPAPDQRPQQRRSPRGAAGVVAIGASTGGPRVLELLLSSLPANYSPAVLVVQHMADGFVIGLVSWLRHRCALPIKVAEQGDLLQSGHVLFAPTSAHVTVLPGGRVRLQDDEPVMGCRPSVNVAFLSLARAYGPRAAGVLLTGMGTDGATGLLAMRRAGGVTLVQDEASCAIFGMPRAAIDLGAAQHVLPPAGIARSLIALHAERVRPSRQ